MKNGKENNLTPDFGEVFAKLFEREIEIIREINSLKGECMVIGGVACNLHGIIRGTKDLDFLIPKGNVQNTERVLEALKSALA